MTDSTLPIVDYQNPLNNPEKSGSPLRFLGCLTFSIFGILVIISLLLPALCSAKEPANRVKCASNLRQIGQALQLYNADQKAFPDSALKLITLTDLSTEVFICPSTHDKSSPSDNPTLQNHCSYIFLFENKSSNASAETIHAYESLKNHDDKGANFLYADGHVEWFPKPIAAAMIKDLEAGINPPGDNSSTRRQ